jgi:hypothetical protein
METPSVCAISRMPGGFVRFRASVFLRRRSGLSSYRATILTPPGSSIATWDAIIVP